METYLISDTHFSHDRMVELCARPSDYNERILIGLETLTKPSIIVHLGDFAFYKHEYWAKQFVGATHMHKRILVMGNHDHKSANWYMDNGFDFACDNFSLKIHGHNIVFSHRPMECEDLNIHGHLHNNGHRPAICDGRHINISIEESDYKPVSLRKVIERWKNASEPRIIS